MSENKKRISQHKNALCFLVLQCIAILQQRFGAPIGILGSKIRVLSHVKRIFTMLVPRWWAQGQGWWEPWAQGSGWWEPWPRAQGGGSHGPRVVGALGSGWLEPRAQGGWSLGPEGFLEESDPPFKSEGTSLISKYGTLHICKYGHGHIFKNRRQKKLNGGCGLNKTHHFVRKHRVNISKRTFFGKIRSAISLL